MLGCGAACGNSLFCNDKEKSTSLLQKRMCVYVTKCQKVRKSWVKILTVSKIWSNYIVLVLHLECSEMAQKNSGHNINIYAEAHMEIFASEGDLSSEIGLMKTDNLTVTSSTITYMCTIHKFNFMKDYERSIPLHNSVNINGQIFNLCSWSFLKDCDDQRRV